MAAIEPYSPCPCGSGQKFKWCCHKVESYADRSQRLFEGGQLEAALTALDEGLRREKGNAWLLIRKAVLLLRLGRPEESKEALRELLRNQPKHLGAAALLTRLVAETEGAADGAAQLQPLLSLEGPERARLNSIVALIAGALLQSGDYPAALRHARLAQSLSPKDAVAADRLIRTIQIDPVISPWFKQEDELLPVPEGATGPAADRFREALGWAGAGRWASAASAFETLADDPAVGPAASRNLGLCRLWLADDAGAILPLRRYRERLGRSPEAVDIEALCQLLEPDPPEQMVEHVQLTWPLRDRDGLLKRLQEDPSIEDEGEVSLDPEDPEGSVAQEFVLLDRPNPYNDEPLPDGGDSIALETIPEVVGRVLVAKETAILDTYDDGRLDGQADRFTTLAGPTVPPAHPRTKVIDKVARRQLGLIWEWRLPDGLSGANRLRLTAERGSKLIEERWPTLPSPGLKGRTPLQAAGAGDAEVPLRAALQLLVASPEPWARSYDFSRLRSRLNLPAEPEIDPETVDPATVHLSRLPLIPADRLSDEKLVALYRRAHETFSSATIERTARLLTDRPGVAEAHGVPSIQLYMDLATLASRQGRHAEALELLGRGRKADPPQVRALHAPRWDLYELRVRVSHQTPEEWVPELAAILERYEANPDAMRLVVVYLAELGLVEVVQRSEDPDDVLLDTRPLQAILSRYGPRVTTATGRLGVSAAKPEIWTPASATPTGGASPIWTPGSASPGAESAPKKLIL